MSDLRDNEKKFAEKKKETSPISKVIACPKCQNRMIEGKCWDEKKNYETVFYCYRCKVYHEEK